MFSTQVVLLAAVAGVASAGLYPGLSDQNHTCFLRMSRYSNESVWCR